jgi:hypothetical protein
MNVGVLIPKDDSISLLAFVLTQLDLRPVYEAYDACREKRRREEAARKRKAAERGAGELAVADETESADTQSDRGGNFRESQRRDEPQTVFGTAESDAGGCP